jgi:aspartyl protease family protein
VYKFLLAIFGFALLVGMLAPSGGPDAPASSALQAREPGLFESAPYKETRLERKRDGHFYVTAYVEGTPVTFVVDTGASAVALTQEAARAIGLEFSPSEFEPVARTANGIAEGKRVTLSKVSIEGKDVTAVDAMIIENGDVSLLGQAYLSRISGVEMAGEYMILR